MKFNFTLSNPPFSLQKEIYDCTNTHANTTIMLGTKMLAKHSGAYFEYGAEWASLFGDGREILVPICFVISNKKPERDINSQIEYDFDKKLESIKAGDKVQNVTICRPFGIYIWNDKQSTSNIIWNVETKCPEILESPIVADMLYLAPKNGSWIYRDLWVLEKLKQHGLVDNYNIEQVKKVSKKSGRGRK